MTDGPLTGAHPTGTPVPGASFSLLLPVYRGDTAAHFLKAFTTSVQGQTLPPSEVVIVQDGPIDAALAAEIGRVVAASPVPVVHHVLERNVGLAKALTEGLALCAHDIVARMDADDISLPGRFAAQVPLIDGGLDLVGTGMLEFLDEAGRIVGRRVPRTGQAEIERYARFHDPFSHPTVVYRRSAVSAAGGYQSLGMMEDYWLFARMIAAGALVDNIPDPLVMYRVGDGAYARRGGRAQWDSELMLQKALRRIRFTTRGQYLRNVAVRGLYRYVPEPVRRFAYRKFIARGGALSE
ncbi:Glycosyltransferase involved in cell wall bisynthesis [Cryobacterium psychrotolerans]|uniref:Glycosyltransferase involved in cell wall bisynthesis n=1 Tax=Cryobacterium psychrotolerans TaxID=386301 RepID=A0A1G9CK54_9MICO|nr:glycosyltransferase [Cryobacterium psychrotolerans]SDK51999.1 Glycosyltransferase involved in cell wall bisynthesis [Cryobacterium psychrotolerans]